MRAHLILLGLLSICSFSLGQECKRDLLKDSDLPSYDLTTVFATDAEHCQRLCTEHSECQFFTFVRPDWLSTTRHFYCYLKASSSEQPASATAVGATAGYSLKACCPGPKPCLSRVYKDVDFYGADYRSLFTADYEECQRVCTQDPSCQFFTFANGAFSNEKTRYKCHLKFSWTIPRTPIVVAIDGATSGFSNKVQMSPRSDTACKSLLLSNTDVQGDDVEVLPAASPQHCQALCSNHPQCTFFSFDSTTFTCSLKNNPDQMVKKPKDKVTSGLPARFCQLANDWAQVPLKGVDLRGSDIRFVLLDDAESCRKACNEDSTCQFYTYADTTLDDSDYWRRCYLKSVVIAPAPPKIIKVPNAVSGFSLRDCV